MSNIYETGLSFNSREEFYDYCESEKFIKEMKEKFGRELPILWVFTVDNKTEYGYADPKKQGIPMDWRFFAEIDPITPEDIEAEKNIEKRRLLIMEYGINKYLIDVEIHNTDAYGTLLSAKMDPSDDFKQMFVKVRNGTIEPEENREYLRERGMLTDDNHKIYYIPVSDDVRTAKEGIEESWGLPNGTLPAEGWDYET